MMAMLVNTAGEYEQPEKGYITISEPACGSGAMVIGAVWEMQRNRFDYQNKCLFIAHDIDILYVWMAYIQLFLYRIPAVVVHGNTLTLEEWSHWYTPAAIALLQRTTMEQETA